MTKAIPDPRDDERIVMYDYSDRLLGWMSGLTVEVRQ